MRSFAFQPFGILIELLIYFIVVNTLVKTLKSIFYNEYEYWTDKEHEKKEDGNDKTYII